MTTFFGSSRNKTPLIFVGKLSLAKYQKSYHHNNYSKMRVKAITADELFSTHAQSEVSVSRSIGSVVVKLFWALTRGNAVFEKARTYGYVYDEILFNL